MTMVRLGSTHGFPTIVNRELRVPCRFRCRSVLPPGPLGVCPSLAGAGGLGSPDPRGAAGRSSRLPKSIAGRLLHLATGSDQGHPIDPGRARREPVRAARDLLAPVPPD